jgi:hypothetical protein
VEEERHELINWLLELDPDLKKRNSRGETRISAFFR